MELNVNERSGLYGLIGGALMYVLVSCENNAPVPGTPENNSSPFKAALITAAAVTTISRVGAALFSKNNGTVTSDQVEEEKKPIYIGKNEVFVGNKCPKENTGEEWLSKNDWVGANTPNGPKFF